MSHKSGQRFSVNNTNNSDITNVWLFSIYLQIFIFTAMVAITFVAGCWVIDPQNVIGEARGYRQARQAPYGPPPSVPYKSHPEDKLPPQPYE